MDASALGCLAKSTSQATARLLIFVLALQAASLQAFAPDRDGKRGQPDESAQHRSPITRELPVSEKAGPSALVGTMAVQPLALFVVGSTSLTTSDAAVKSRLEGLGYSVTVKSANNSATTDANSTNLIVISSTVNPSQVNTKFRDVTVPVIVYESALFDDMKMTGTKSTDFGSTTGQSVIQIVDASHSIASGLSGSVAVVSTGDTFSWGVPSPYAQKIATLSSNSARATIFAYENGATMVGQVAPARRVGVFLSDTVPQNLTADGWKLFDGAVDWSVKRVHRQCLFVTGSLTLSASDSEIKKQLEGRGFTVTVSTGAAVTASDAALKNLVVVSASVTGADVNTKMRDVAAPVVVAEPDLFDDMKMTGATGGADFGSAASQTTVSIVDSAHALAGGLTGTVTISMSGTTIGWGKPSSSAAKVAAIASDNSKIALFGYAEGASMVGLTAPGRRVGLFFGETLGSVATEGGWRLFVSAVEWANSATPLCLGEAAVDVLVVIDRSGSMAGQRITDAKAAAKGFVDSMSLATDQAGVASFSDTGTLDHQLSHNAASIKSSIDAIVTGGGTNIGGGITAAQNELTSPRHQSGSLPIIVLLTDGANTVGDPIAAANAAKAGGTRIIAIGLGEANNPQMLSVVSSPNDYYYAPSSADLSGLYTSIAGELCRDPNQNPTVDAGPDQTITLPATASLAGTATDDGLPTGAALTTTWSKVSGPGTVTFANPAALGTTATFSEPGAYVLRLTADDSELTGSDDLTITVNPAPVNAPPVVAAGPDQTITLPAEAILDGSATDDGLPQGSTLTVGWIKVSGPGTVTFANANQAATTAGFSAAGTYGLRLIASDSALSTSDDATVTVIAENHAPVADSGPDLTITLPASATLNGTATDDGLPQGSTLAVSWTKVSGPGTVTFASPSSAQTTATFDTPGTYVLRLTATDSDLSASDDVTVTVQPAPPPPVASFTVAGVPMHVPATVLASSGWLGGSTPANLLDNNAQSAWNPPQTTNQFVTAQFTGGEQFVERVQVQAPQSTFAVKNFEVLLSQTSNDADFVSVLSGVYTTTGSLQEFVLPSGPVRARFAKFIARDNYGGGSLVIQTLNVLTAGSHDSVVTLAASNNVARAESPSLAVNGGRIVAASDDPGGSSVNDIITFNNGTDGWRPSADEDKFVTIELAGGRLYTIEGVRLSGSVKNFEVWVSSTTTDATAFTRVLTGVNNSSAPVTAFLFPGGPVQARYVKYMPLPGGDTNLSPSTLFFDVIASEAGGVVGFSSASSIFGLPDRTIDPDTTNVWTSASTQTTNQFIKIRLTGGRVHSIYGVRIQPSTGGSVSAPKDFEIRVSTTTADDSAFTTVFSGTLQNTNNLQEFLFAAPVDAKYVQFFFAQAYGTGFVGVSNLKVLEPPQDGALLLNFSSQSTTASEAAALALDVDTGNGPWFSAAGQNANQYLVLQLQGNDPWIIDRVVLEPGHNISTGDTTVRAKNFDILASTTDSNDASFTTVFSGTLQNAATLQEFAFTPVPARFIKLLLRDNYGSTSQIALFNFYAVSPQMGSTNASFVDRSTISSGAITSWSWDFGDGGASAARDARHVYAQPGDYTVRLTVTSSAGQTSSTQILYHALAPLVPDFSSTPLSPGEALDRVSLFDRSVPRMINARRTWDLNVGGSATGSNASLIYGDNGSFPVKLTIGDPNDFHYEMTKSIDVRNLPPTIGATPGATLVWGQTWTPSVASLSDPSATDSQSLRCNWAYGDGSGTEISQCTAAKASQSTHAYQLPGLYVARLNAFDKDGGVASRSALNVVNRRPTAFTGMFADGSQNGSVTVSAKLIDDFSKAPLAGRTVTFALGGATATAISNASGDVQAALPYSPGLTSAVASVSVEPETLYLGSGAGVEVAGSPGVTRCASDSRGVDFWLMFPGNAGFNPLTLQLIISGDTATSGTISAPGVPFNANFTVQPGVATRVTVPVSAVVNASDTIQNKGVHVTAQAPVSVYGLEAESFASDGFLALPTQSLGTNYITLGYRNVDVENASDFGIVATANNTTITITTSDTVGTHTAGTPYTITMNQGQTYQLIDTDNFPSDLSGTTIVADNPITVYGGHTGANIPGSQPFANPIFEQLPPVASWSRSFALMPSASRLADTVRAIASVDNTHVFLNGARVATLNRGEFAELLFAGPAHIIADQPVMVAQYNNSTSFDPGSNDPSMLLVPGLDQFLDHYTVGTADQTIFTAHFINIVAPNAAVGSVTLDGAAVVASSFTPIAQSGYSGARISVAAGTHTLAGPAPFGVSVYGFGQDDAYSFPGGMCVTSQLISVQVALEPQSANHPTGTQACVTTTVTDLNNNPVAGVLVSFAVTGVNPATGSAVTDSNGQAQFCYTGANPGSDLVRATTAGTSVTAAKTWGIADNQPPAVSAGPNQTITLPANTAMLNGAASDDGLPLGGALTLTWTQISGPAGVVFASPSSAVTNATFPSAGTYVLQLAAGDSELTSTSTTTVTVRAATANQAPFVDAGPSRNVNFEDNLILNGDNEAALVSGQIPNWTVVSGTWLQGTTATGAAPFNGTKYFFADSSAEGELRQDVNVTAWAATINAHRQQFAFSAWVRSKDESPADSARIIIEYRDPTNSLVLASLDSGSIVSTANWALLSDTRTAPEGTGFVRVRLIATRAAGTTNDAYFDQVVLRALGGVGVKLQGIVSDDALPAGSTLTTNWTAQILIGNIVFEDASKTVTSAVFDTQPNSTTFGNTNTLKLSASDSELTASATTNVNVFRANQEPRVNAGENQSIQLPASASLNATVEDDDGSTVTRSWSKLSGPGTVTFSAPGETQTTASFSTAGVYVLRLKASDAQYSSAGDVTVTVTAAPPVNQAPVVSAGMSQTTTMPYNAITLNGAAVDDGLPAGSHLIVSWSQVSGPAQATFSVANAVSTQVTLPAVGSYVLKLTASDGELSSSATVNVTLNPQPPENQAPVVNPGPNQTITLPTTTVTLNGSVQDDGLPEGAVLTITWSQAGGPAGVTFSSPNQTATQATFPGSGAYLLQLTVSDTEFTVISQVAVTVNPEPPPPGGTVTVHIDSPADGTVITSRTPIVATIGGGASTWTLEYALDADEDILAHNWTAFASGSGAVTAATIGTFDPTLLLNGTYLVRLTGRDAGGNPSVDQIALTVRGQQKVGNFTLSFNDLTIPVAGLPIQVIRTYDSRDKRQGDFGIGWTLGIKNVRVEKSGILGKLWDETVTPGVLPKYCLEPTRPKTVTITFPDGKQYRFNAVPAPQCQLASPITGPEMSYVQIAGDSGTGGATLTAVGNNSVIVDAAVPGLVNLVNLTNQRIYNPTRFQLTTAEKYVYTIDQTLGVTAMTDPNGNTLTINSSGVIHSSGKSILFTRDSSGRITRITDPSGSELNYSFNLAGDLASFTDRAGETTNFSYNAAHGLLTIADPRGIQPIRNEYDAEGRLLSHTDAFGHVINYTHNLAANHEEITDRLGHTTTYEYDANGNVLTLTDAQNNTTTYTYDDRDNKLTETNALGKTTTFTYDAKDDVETQTDPLGNVTRYTYNDLRQVLTVTDPKLGVTTNEYDLKGNLLSTEDAAGNTTSFTYLQSGVRDTMTDALGKVTRYEYAGFSSPTRETDPLGHSTSYAYDANGNRVSQTTTRTLASGATETLTTTFEYDLQNRLKKTIYPDGTSTRVGYNTIGQQVATIDQLGRQTSFEYDAMGRMTRTVYPDTTSESSTYDAEGRRLTSTDRAGRVTQFEYDEVGRLKKTTYIDGTFTTTAYDAIGRVISTTDGRGNTTTYEYDANCGCSGRRSKITDAMNHETQFSYDDNGNQSSMTDANGHVMTYEYDALNRRTKVIYADTTFDETAYDALGRVISKTDQAGKVTQYGYDALGRLIRVTDALNQITQYGYDELGNQTSQTDALGRITKFEYDKLGRRTRRTLPLGQVETYTYNSAGNLLTRRDFNAKTTTYAYDAMNRLLSKTPDVSFASPAITFTYLPTGRRLTMTDAHGVTSYGYDTRGRLLTKATPEGTLSYSYDAASNALTLRSSNTNGASVDYSYDSLNRLSTVTGNASGVRAATGMTTYRYDDVGNLAGYLYPNGVDTSYQYNPLNRLTSMSLTKASSPLSSFTYELGAAGNRTSVTELSGRHVDYTYDDLYRLKSETIGLDPVTANNGAINYTYDAVGNRLNRTSTIAAIPTTTSTFNTNDQLGGDTYDAGGNTTGSAGKTYVYDFENRIKSVNSGQIVFVYDGDGNRVSKTVGGVTTKFLVDTNNPTGYAQVVEEIVGSNVQRVYAHGHSLISQTQLISGNWVTSFYGYDGHGIVRLLTDAIGVITDTYTYDAFGNLISSTGTTPNNYLYAGEQLDPNLGFYYLRARYMNPSAGRFWTTDQLEGLRYDPLSNHKYLYVAADPVNKLDPSGLETLVTTLGSLNIYTTIQALAVAAVGTCALTLIASEIARSQGFDVEAVPGPGSACIRKDDGNAEVTVFRGLKGTSPSEFKRALEDPDGLSTYEILYPSDYTFFLPFRVRYRRPKSPHVVGIVLNSPIPGAAATFTPEFGDPTVGLYHWSLQFPGTLDEIKDALSKYAKSNKQPPYAP